MNLYLFINFLNHFMNSWNTVSNSYNMLVELMYTTSDFSELASGRKSVTGTWSHRLINVWNEEANRIFKPQSFTLFHIQPPINTPTNPSTNQPTNQQNNSLTLPCYCIHSLFLDTCFLSWCFSVFGTISSFPWKLISVIYLIKQLNKPSVDM